MRSVYVRSFLGAVIAAFAVALLPAVAKAQSAGEQICQEIYLDLREFAFDYALTPSAVSRWCVAFLESTIEVTIPLIYDLQPTDVHPSTISAGLDRELPTATAALLNDFISFSDADGLYSSRYRWQATCTGTTCRETNPTTGRVHTYDMKAGKVSGRGIQWTPLGQKDGVTLVKRESRQRHAASGTYYDWTRYGAWASDSFFFSGWREGVSGRYVGSGGAYSYSIGRASIGNPAFLTARYSGFMTGVDVSSSYTRGNSILGRADIAFDGRGAAPTVDVSFTEALDVATLDEHRDMHWSNIPVRSGAFSRGSDANSIQGRFYGTRHQEVGGIFERNRISGAFGAARK